MGALGVSLLVPFLCYNIFFDQPVCFGICVISPKDFNKMPVASKLRANARFTKDRTGQRSYSIGSTAACCSLPEGVSGLKEASNP